MKIAIMQPYFFPYMPYFQLIHAVDKWVNLDHVTFIKQGYIHRNNIKDELVIRAPCMGASSNTLISKVGLDFESREWKKQLKTLDQAYKKAKNYDVLRDLLIGSSKLSTNLSEFNFHLIKEICKYLDITTKLISTSKGLSDKPNIEGVTEIVKNLRGDFYINAIGGMDLYSKEEFASNDIELKFLKTKLQDDFKSLSIFHVLCMCTQEEIREKLDDYILI
jgi:hypothetical protein